MTETDTILAAVFAVQFLYHIYVVREYGKERKMFVNAVLSRNPRDFQQLQITTATASKTAPPVEREAHDPQIGI